MKRKTIRNRPFPGGNVAGLLAAMQIKSIQSGYASGTTTVYYQETVDIPITAVDLSRAFVIIPGGGCVNATRGVLSARLTSSTNLRLIIQTGNNGYHGYGVHWMVLEGYNIKVQRGLLSVSVAASTLDTSNTVTITAVNLARAFAIGAGCHINGAGNDEAPKASFRPTTKTALSFALANTESLGARTIETPWQMVEILN